MKLLSKEEIPENIRGIVYLCELKEKSIEVFNALMFDSGFDALNAYANIPNPESQLVTGKDYDELCTNLEALHKDMKDPEWIKRLHESI